MNLSEVLRGLKNWIEEIKLFLEHHQIVDVHARALQVVKGLFWCPSIYFQLQILILKTNQIFNISYFSKPKITQKFTNHRKT